MAGAGEHTANLEHVVRRYTSIAAVIDMLRRRKLPLLNPAGWDDRNDRYFMKLYKDARSLGGLYRLSAAQCSETYHHWKVFTSGADGACIEIMREPLEALLSALDNLRFGTVEYLTLSRADRLGPADLEQLPFYKQQGFTDEAEYRIMAWTPEEQQAALPIDFPLALIGCIELNPWLPPTIAESVRAVMKSIAPAVPIEIRSSHFTDSARWKRAGDRVVDREPQRTVRLPRKPISRTTPPGG